MAAVDNLIERAAGPSPIMMSSWIVLHRRIEHFFDDRRKTMDLVDEQYVARLQVGEECGEIARSLEHRAGRLAQIDAELGGENVASVVLPRPGGPKINT
jgi:hypothetical protein